MTEQPIRKRLERQETPQDWRYLTCSTYRRFQFFDDPEFRDVFAKKLEDARRVFGFELRAWVLMPEHFHIMLHPLNGVVVPQILKRLKQGTAKVLLRQWGRCRPELIARATHDDGSLQLWQAGGGFDRNVRDSEEMEREIRYIHNNPVKRGLVKQPTDWAWSSARHYDNDMRSPVQIVYRKWSVYRDGGPMADGPT